MIVYAVVDETISPTSPLGDAIDVFLRREDAQRFIEEIDGDDPELAELLRIEERELEAGRPLLRREALAGLRGPRYEWNRETLFSLL